MKPLAGSSTSKVFVCQYCITKVHRQGGINSRNLFSPFWRWLVVGVVSPGTTFLGLQVISFWLRPHGFLSVCIHVPGTTFLPFNDTSLGGSGSHHFDLN